MHFLENEYILKNYKIKHILKFGNVTLTIFLCMNRYGQSTTQFLNNIHDNIKFTVEKEKDKSINFLDFNIKNNNNKFGF